MINARWIKYDLKFKFRAGTSRGFLTGKTSYFIILKDQQNQTGIGECGPLKGLSPDDRPDIEDKLSELCLKVTEGPVPTPDILESYLDE